MSSSQGNSVRERQAPLRERYQANPAAATIIDRGRTRDGVQTDPFHGVAVPGSQEYGVAWPFGIHSAVGGYHDGPNPGDFLCMALATCLDSTIRIVAERMGLALAHLSVDVTAELDVRGTLMFDRTVPVGFKAMRCQVDLRPAGQADPALVQKVLAFAERSCVNMQTLRSGVTVEVSSTAAP